MDYKSIQQFLGIMLHFLFSLKLLKIMLKCVTMYNTDNENKVISINQSNHVNAKSVTLEMSVGVSSSIMRTVWPLGEGVVWTDGGTLQ